MTRPAVRLRVLLSEARVPNTLLEGAGTPRPPGPAGLGTAVTATEDPEITEIVINAAEAGPGSLFACIKGAHADGHQFAPEAVSRGAVAVLGEHELAVGVPQVLVPSSRAALGPISSALWGNPSKSMHVVGVTGTNGKTTTCALLAGIFDAQGWHAGVIGTLTGARTTPEAPMLQKRLAELRGQGARAVAMEVSSHSLEQHRVDGTDFAAAIFTNLSQDHLDYHGTMESYFEAKAKLFSTGLCRLAVVNRSDRWGEKLARRLEGGPLPVVTFGPEDATDVAVGPRHAEFTWRGERLQLNMGGRFNVSNALAAATTAVELGVGKDAIVKGLASVNPVRGRFEPVEEGQPFAVLVDFAHTPAALAEALKAARELAAGRVIVVFGAGGERDRSKRPLLGRVASELADVVVVTTDNPRRERPEDIIAEVLAGVEGLAPVVEPDRAEAIAGALSMAGPGDVVLLAGKGHETGQDFGDHIDPFDDAAVARAVLARAGRAGGDAAHGPR